MSIAAAESKNRVSIFQSFMSVNTEPSRTTAIIEYDGDACSKEKYNWGKCVIENNIANTCKSLEAEYAKCIIKSIDISKNPHQQVCESTK